MVRMRMIKKQIYILKLYMYDLYVLIAGKAIEGLCERLRL